MNNDDKAIHEYEEEMKALQDKEDEILSRKNYLEEQWEEHQENRKQIEDTYEQIFTNGRYDAFYVHVERNYEDIRDSNNRIQNNIEDAIEDAHEEHIKILIQMDDLDIEYKKMPH